MSLCPSVNRNDASSPSMNSASSTAVNVDIVEPDGPVLEKQTDKAEDAPIQAGEVLDPAVGDGMQKAADDVEKQNDQQGDELHKKPSLKDQTNLLPFRQLIVVFLGLAICLCLSLLDQTIVANLLPTLAKDFNSGRSVTWVATSYLVSSTAFQPIVGRMSDIFGRKRTMLFSIGIFWVGSLATSVSQSINQVIAFRSIQGIGGGAILTLVMIIMSDVVSLKERGKYQGILSSFFAISNGSGQIIGGAIAERTTWRWAFYINLPLGVFAFLVIAFFLPLKHVKGSIKSKLKQVDWGGCTLILAASCLLLLALQWAGSTYAWDSAHVLVPLVLGLCLFPVFILYEWRIPPIPVLPLHLFSNVSLTACYISTATNGLIYYTQLFYLPQYFQVLKGASPIRSGVLIVPLILTMVTVSTAAGFIVSKTGEYRWNIIAGWVIWTVSLGLISTLDQNSSTAKIAGYLVLTGVGSGQTFQTTLVAIQASVERKEMAIATSLRNFIRLLGGTLALAIAQTILSNALRSNSLLNSTQSSDILDNPISIYSTNTLTAGQIQDARSAYRNGFRIVWLMCTVLAGLSTLVVLFFLKHYSLKRSDDEEQKARSQAWLSARQERHQHGYA